MERLIIRIEKNKNFIEYGKPLLIFVDDIDAAGFVTCATFTGHTAGEYSAIIKQTRPITPDELKAFNGCIYGYNLTDFKIVKRRAAGNAGRIKNAIEPLLIKLFKQGVKNEK